MGYPEIKIAVGVLHYVASRYFPLNCILEFYRRIFFYRFLHFSEEKLRAIEDIMNKYDPNDKSKEQILDSKACSFCNSHIYEEPDGATKRIKKSNFWLFCVPICV